MRRLSWSLLVLTVAWALLLSSLHSSTTAALSPASPSPLSPALFSALYADGSSSLAVDSLKESLSPSPSIASSPPSPVSPAGPGHSSRSYERAVADFEMTQLTDSAPWSPRMQPALLPMHLPITYTSVLTNAPVTTGTPWLLLYEGADPVQGAMENDVWCSQDDGATWDLIAGVSRWGSSGQTVAAIDYGNSSFIARAGAANCEDPNTDEVFSLAGYTQVGSQIAFTSDVWWSDHGLVWGRLTSSFTPARYYSACDVTEQSHLLMMGGLSNQNVLLNDVWASYENSWRRQTLRAAWAPRAEHLILIGYNAILDAELVYVLGGYSVYQSAEGGSRQTNDVWVSSDEGVTWALVTRAAPWSTRWGHGGVLTYAGVLLLVGGTHNDPGQPSVNQGDVWASYDGGVSWSACSLPDGASFVRGSQGVALNDYEELIVASGFAYNADGSRTPYNDVWKTAFSLQDPETLLPLCGGSIPDAGVGLSSWPRALPPVSSTAPVRSSSSTSAPRASSSSTSAPATAVARSSSTAASSSARPSSSSSSAATSAALPTSTMVPASTAATGTAPPVVLTSFSFASLTGAAPFSARLQPALVAMTRSVSVGGLTLNPPWLALFEGASPSLSPAAASLSGLSENDVWASITGGSVWQLISGQSRFGRSGVANSSNPLSSFDASAGAATCADPLSGRLYAMGGAGVDSGSGEVVALNSVWLSDNAVQWTQATAASWSPRLHFGSAVSSQGRVLAMGGSDGGGGLLNDVWGWDGSSAAWEQRTASASWGRRAQMAVVAANAPLLSQQVLYVVGGLRASQQSWNDVWVSSDDGQSWAVASAAAPWEARWGLGLVATAEGMLVLVGGANAPDGGDDSAYTLRDVWASLDGGLSWSRCSVTPAPSPFLRVQQGLSLDSAQRLVVASGFSAYPGSDAAYANDVWRTSFSLSDFSSVAKVCAATVPTRGPGLSAWPGPVTPPRRASSSSSSSSGGATAPAAAVLSLDLLTRTAPWSGRIQPALLQMASPITYTQVPSGVQVTTPPNWWLLYEGSLAVTQLSGETVNENDVWASTDGGSHWDLIAGVSFFGAGSAGPVASAQPNSSFDAVAGSSNCEDPTSDVVYSLGGLQLGQSPSPTPITTVWISDDGLQWSKLPGDTFSPGRYFASCDVNSRQTLLVMGGLTTDVRQALNDVWRLSSSGQWSLVTAAAPWSARGEHLVLVGEAPLLRAEVVYVLGGSTPGATSPRAETNDVWVSSDEGQTWAQVTDAAQWGPRWGHVGAITSAGLLVVLGGLETTRTALATYTDVWTSFDGGYTWTQCNVRDGAANAFVRGEQAFALTVGEEMLLGSGYYWDAAGQSTFRDLWKSPFSLSNLPIVAAMCNARQPSAGVGLQYWPLTPPPLASTGGGGPTPASTGSAAPPSDDKSSSGLSGAGVFGIVFALLIVVLGASAAGYYFYRQRVLGRPAGYGAEGGDRFGGLAGFGSGGGGFRENSNSLLSQGGSSEFYMEMTGDAKPGGGPAVRQWTS